MPLLKVEAEKLSQNVLLQGIVEEIITSDQLFALLPFQQVNGKTLDYTREGELATVDFLDPNDTVNESSSKFTEVSTKLRIILGDVDVDKFLNETMSDTNGQFALQLQQKIKAMSRTFRDALINGDNAANPKQFDGLAKAIPATQKIAVAGALTLAAMDELLDKVKLGADVIVMRSGTRRAYVQQLRLAGGNTGAMLQHPTLGTPILSHNGVPIIVNDFIKAPGAVGSEAASVFALRLNEADGFHGLFGGSSAGIRVEDIGTVQNKDATRTRVKWYCGTALKATHAVAELTGVTNV